MVSNQNKEFNMKWQWVAILILLSCAIIFTAQNYEVVSIKFLFWSFATSRAIVIFATLFIGILIGWISAYLRRKNKQA